MINFNVTRRRVIFEYMPEFTSSEWILGELKTHHQVTLSRGFTFSDEDLIESPNEVDPEEIGEPTFHFHFASRTSGYFIIPGRILGIENDVFIDESVWLERKLFIAERNVGIFLRIAKVKQNAGDIVIGGNLEGAIPLDVFQDLLKRFPNSGEVDRYASARVEAIVGEFFDGMKSARDNYEVYLSKRKSSVSETPLAQDQLLQTEMDKFAYLRDTIIDWLSSAVNYSEQDWQRMIIKIILLIFPKYVAVLENVHIADYYSSPGRNQSRFIDLCLIDAGGNIDVIEIKKPFDNVILGKTRYRDNSVPTRELSGSIMQAEKYIFHLSKWGVVGEKELNRKHSAELPDSMHIRVTNPKAMIILGRDRTHDGQPALSEQQLFDLEIIKRKYANMIDILTYDDLLRRLNNIINSLSKRKDAAQ